MPPEFPEVAAPDPAAPVPPLPEPELGVPAEPPDGDGAVSDAPPGVLPLRLRCWSLCEQPEFKVAIKAIIKSD